LFKTFWIKSDVKTSSKDEEDASERSKSTAEDGVHELLGEAPVFFLWGNQVAA